MSDSSYDIGGQLPTQRASALMHTHLPPGSPALRRPIQ
jgi:hypothetical protein